MKEFESANILVTGGAGFVGGNLVRFLVGNGCRSIHIIDNLLSSEKVNIPEDLRIQFTEGSIADDRILEKLEDRYDFIFHLATYHGNQSSIHNPIADHENNTITTLKLYERIRKFENLKKVIYSSAGCSVAEKTFDEVRATVESDLVSVWSDSPYSMSKIFGEFYSNYYFKQHGLPIVRARFQNVYGPGEILGAGKWRGTMATIWRNVVPTFIYKALKQEPLPLENNGIATRDFIYVEDIVRGLLACALKGQPGEVYNLASGRETSISELAKKINEMTQNPSGISVLPKRTWDNSGKRYGCPEKALKELCFKAGVDIEDGLEHTIRWTRTHLALIDSIKNKHEVHL
ncbi:MAG: NAD-dependent epimerase/dehydratase family protein [Candidatus Omnitrophica bacterium]|nr:NAD-dependent epimerase/dehydratase family protein [Candidatus Omnitrophota bacterium]